MFVALDKNNQRVTLTSHAQAANLTHQTFHCPICKQVVRIKNGTVMPAHFAHRSQPMGEGEPESIEHLTGKWWLASWLKQYGEQATLEYYDATIRQRADLLVASKPPRVAGATVDDAASSCLSTGPQFEWLPMVRSQSAPCVTAFWYSGTPTATQMAVDL